MDLFVVNIGIRITSPANELHSQPMILPARVIAQQQRSTVVVTHQHRFFRTGTQIP
jgi:hypothetical protein